MAEVGSPHPGPLSQKARGEVCGVSFKFPAHQHPSHTSVSHQKRKEIAMKVAASALVMFLLLATAPPERPRRRNRLAGLARLEQDAARLGKGPDRPLDKREAAEARREAIRPWRRHPRAERRVDRPGRRIERFLATVGVDDSAGRPNGTTFKIAGDGKVLFKWNVMNPGQPPKAVDIDLKGVKTLVLMVSAAGGSIDFAHGDWADARFLVSGAKPRTIDAPVSKAVVLTPPPPPAPRINGAKIFGVRPGSPFFFTIPATGQRPMTFAVEGLPPGEPRSPDRPHQRAR